MKWRVHMPNLIKEMVEGNPSGGALMQPANIFMRIMCLVAQRAIELDDPELNVLMLRLQLYDIEPGDLTAAIDQQEARLKEAA
jgi:hypothetical protein